uniref:Uncharacterized protein n=1 Tax=Oryza meridionalis TaxID=40149 RepID=A0A0E0D674_9ORYZ
MEAIARSSSPLYVITKRNFAVLEKVPQVPSPSALARGAVDVVDDAVLAARRCALAGAPVERLAWTVAAGDIFVLLPDAVDMSKTNQLSREETPRVQRTYRFNV